MRLIIISFQAQKKYQKHMQIVIITIITPMTNSTCSSNPFTTDDMKRLLFGRMTVSVLVIRNEVPEA